MARGQQLTQHNPKCILIHCMYILYKFIQCFWTHLFKIQEVYIIGNNSDDDLGEDKYMKYTYVYLYIYKARNNSHFHISNHIVGPRF